MARKGPKSEEQWNALTDSYRRRIERTVGKEYWKSGNNLAGARGHALDYVKKNYVAHKRIPGFEEWDKKKQAAWANNYYRYVTIGKFDSTDKKQKGVEYRNAVLRIALENEKNPVEGESEIWASFRADYAIQMGKA